MASDDFQKHCKKCKKGEPCGQFHVYVLTVDPRLKEGRRSKKIRFRKVNPDTHENGEPLYVGKCECSPRCRQSKHRNYDSNKSTKWYCYCGKYESTNSYHRYRDNPTSIHDFLKGGYGYLQPKHFRKLNPFKTSEEAEIAEEKLAIQLRKDGYAVWAGHHDDKIIEKFDSENESTD